MSDPNKDIRIRIVIEAEVNRDEWNAEYGTNESVATIREHVKMTAKDAVKATFYHLPVEVL